MQWNLNRWYDPSVGKWLSEDPSGLAADANPYRYCDNGPTDATDPSGLELLISCTVRDQVKRYLDTHGITGYELSEGSGTKDTWWSGGDQVRYPKDGGMSAIIGAMIASDYKFSVKGNTQNATMDNM